MKITINEVLLCILSLFLLYVVHDQGKTVKQQRAVINQMVQNPYCMGIQP